MCVLYQPSMHSKHYVWSDCVCMANVIVKRYLPYHISQAAKKWCVPLVSPGFFLEIKVVIFNRRGTHTNTFHYRYSHHLLFQYIFQYSALTLLMTDSVLSKEDISVSGLMFCHTIFQLLFAGGGVSLSLKTVKRVLLDSSEATCLVK